MVKRELKARISMRIDKKKLDQIDKLAAEVGLTRTAMITAILSNHMNKQITTDELLEEKEHG